MELRHLVGSIESVAVEKGGLSSRRGGSTSATEDRNVIHLRPSWRYFRVRPRLHRRYFREEKEIYAA